MAIAIVGLDLAKHVFQVHAVDETGRAVLCRQLRRAGVEAFFKMLSPCIVGMEACASAHYWARRIAALGHEVRLIAPAKVKPYVQHGRKNDANDAAAIVEALMRGPSQSWGSSGHCHWRVWVVSRQEFLPETGAECAVVEGTADLE